MKLVLLCFILLYSTASSFAQHPGTLDPSFGNKGQVLNQSSLLEGETIKVAKDGKILVATLGPYKGFSFTFKIDALLPDGSPDHSFGDNGSAYVLFPGMTKPEDNASISSLALLPDGRIIAGGNLTATDNKDKIAFARFKPDGTVDSSFGTNGTATASFGYPFESAGNILLQPDGKIITGSCIATDPEEFVGHVSTARFLPDGTKDLSYGKEGIVVSTTIGCANGIALQKDGKIVAAGYRGNEDADDARFHLERYNEDGSYDNRFGVNGIVDVQAGTGGGHINDVAIQEDGKIVVTGTSAQPFDLKFTVARFNTDGSLDKSFGQGGVVITNFSQYNGEGKKVFITGEKKDKIVVAGTNYDIFTGSGDFALVGYNADGSLDAQFGNGGIQITNFDDGDYTTGADIQADGKIVLIGYAQSFQTFEDRRALARYYGYPSQVPLFVRIKRWLQNHGISWQGLDNKNISYYSIQYSTTGKGFAEKGKLSGGGSSRLKDYNFNVADAGFYRVVAVDRKGYKTFSNKVLVSAGDLSSAASLYPNPARDYVTVQGLKTNETTNISIANGSGTVLAKGTSNGSTQYRTPTANLQPGMYYIHITTGSKTESLKFVKE